MAGQLPPSAPADPRLAAGLPAGTGCSNRDAPPRHRLPEEAKAGPGEAEVRHP